MTRTQRDALVTLRRALEICEEKGVEVVGMGGAGCEVFTFGSAGGVSLDDLLAAPRVSERLLGKVTPLPGPVPVWDFRPMGPGGALLRWTGQASRAWWSGPALDRNSQLQQADGRTYRLDFVTGQVYEVLL